jgi:hypothetical protein
MRWFDRMICLFAIPFAIALALVIVAAVIAAGIAKLLRFAGVISGRLIDEAEAFAVGRRLDLRKPKEDVHGR